MRFRHDINGLRAIAVVSVVLFHFKVLLFKGGFAGVDVFFVISGYLMTRIIVTRLDEHRFSLLGFYRDRGRRILPALIGLCATLLLAGFVFIEPITYRQIGKHALSALTFVSNILFYREAGYFDLHSDQKWLLHTWSLSVEWQFYIIYPLIFMLIAQASMLCARRTLILWAGFLLSLALSIAMSQTFAIASFFLLPTRAWEMLAGGLVFVHAERLQFRRGSAILIQALGLLAIASSLLVFDSTTPWPSFWALLPVLGSCLVIISKHREAFWADNPLVQLIGTWSYAIYIWHWPIVVAFGYFELGQSKLLMAAALVVLLYCGFLLMSLVRRVIAGLSASDRLPSSTMPASFALVALLAIGVMAGQGLPGRKPDVAERLAAYASAHEDWELPNNCAGLDSAGHLRPCFLGPSRPSQVLFIGDSHAEMIYSRFSGSRSERASMLPLEFLTLRGCAPVPGIGQVSGRPCGTFAAEAFEAAGTSSFKRVVLASIWTPRLEPPGPGVDLSGVCFLSEGHCDIERDPVAFEKRLRDVFEALGLRLRALRQRGVEVVLIQPFPRIAEDLTLEMSKRVFQGRDTTDLAIIDRKAFLAQDAVMRRRLDELAQFVGATVVDPVQYLCGPTTCPTLDETGLPIYRDSNHFSAKAMRSDRFRFLDKLVSG